MASPCLWGKLQNLSFSNVSKLVVMSFCVAGMALPDILMCLETCPKSFCVAGAILLRRFQKITCMFRGKRSTLETSVVISRGRRSTLDVSQCVFFANRIVRAGDNVQIVWQPRGIVRVPFCVARMWQGQYLAQICGVWDVTLRRRRSIWDTLYCTLYTPHSTLDTPHSTLHTLHFKL